jgi:hypothetical protein
MKLGKLVSMDFMNIINKLNRCPMKIKIAYIFRGISEIMNKEANKYEELRMSALKRYAKKDEKDNIISKDNVAVFDGNNFEEFNKEMIELSNTEVAIDKIPFKDLIDTNIMLSPAEISLIEDLLQF